MMIAAIMNVGIYQYCINPFKTPWNHNVIAGNVADEPSSSNTPCIAGIAYKVPTKSNTISKTN